MKKLSVVLATRNEESNIADCIDSIGSIADDIIVVDENSHDRTREIAKRMGARVFKVRHEAIFHKTKQKALDKATGDWILQLDADERLTASLREEIREVIELQDKEMKLWGTKSQKWRLFERHQRIYEKSHGKVGKKSGEVVAFWLPRLNHFVGKPLTSAGVYPDPAIRLIKRGKAWFPAKSVHEYMEIEGEVAWLVNDLEHHDSPTIARYIMRMNRYTELQSQEFARDKLGKGVTTFIFYSLVKPKLVFLKLFIRHKGYKDGIRGFLWSAFLSMHFPLAYYKYLTK